MTGTVRSFCEDIYMNSDSDALDSSAAARRMGLAPSTLAKKRLSGTGPLYYKLGRRVIYRSRDIDAYLDLHRRRSTSDEAPK
jgi:hypothetical protein